MEQNLNFILKAWFAALAFGLLVVIQTSASQPDVTPQTRCFRALAGQSPRNFSEQEKIACNALTTDLQAECVEAMSASNISGFGHYHRVAPSPKQIQACSTVSSAAQVGCIQNKVIRQPTPSRLLKITLPSTHEILECASRE